MLLLTVNKYFDKYRSSFNKLREDEQDRLTKEAKKLIGKVATLCAFAEIKYPKINLGWCPDSVVKKLDKHPSLKHAQGVEIEDKDQVLYTWCLANVEYLMDSGVYVMSHDEDKPEESHEYVHFQIVPPENEDIIFSIH